MYVKLLKYEILLFTRRLIISHFHPEVLTLVFQQFRTRRLATPITHGVLARFITPSCERWKTKRKIRIFPRFDRQLRRSDELETFLRRFVRGFGREPGGPGRSAVHGVLPATPFGRVWGVRVGLGRGRTHRRRAVPPPVPDRVAATTATAPAAATAPATATATAAATATATATDPTVRVGTARRLRRPVGQQAFAPATAPPGRRHDQPAADRTHVQDNEAAEPPPARTDDAVQAHHDASKSISVLLNRLLLLLLLLRILISLSLSRPDRPKKSAPPFEKCPCPAYVVTWQRMDV